MTPQAIRGDTPVAGAAWPWWATIAAYFAAICLMHLQFSLWLVKPRETPWGRLALAEAVPAVMTLGALVLAVVVIGQLRRSPRRWTLASGWLLCALAALAIDRWLTYSASETFHYPQYALLAWLLARALDPQRRHWIVGRVLFWTTLLGAADELLQYLWITASYSHYFDFNDVLVNLVGAAVGVLLYYGAAAEPTGHRPRHRAALLELLVGVNVALLIAVALLSGRLQPAPVHDIAPGGLGLDSEGRPTIYLQRSPGQHGSWQSGPHRGRYYVLRPVEGLLGLGVAGLLITVLLGSTARGQRSRGDDAAATIAPSSAAKSR